MAQFIWSPVGGGERGKQDQGDACKLLLKSKARPVTLGWATLRKGSENTAA